MGMAASASIPLLDQWPLDDLPALPATPCPDESALGVRGVRGVRASKAGRRRTESGGVRALFCPSTFRCGAGRGLPYASTRLSEVLRRAASSLSRSENDDPLPRGELETIAPPSSIAAPGTIPGLLVASGWRRRPPTALMALGRMIIQSRIGLTTAGAAAELVATLRFAGRAAGGVRSAPPPPPPAPESICSTPNGAACHTGWVSGGLFVAILGRSDPSPLSVYRSSRRPASSIAPSRPNNSPISSATSSEGPSAKTWPHSGAYSKISRLSWLAAHASLAARRPLPF